MFLPAEMGSLRREGLVLALIALFSVVSPAVVQGQSQTGSVSGAVYGFTCGDDVIPLTGARVYATLIETGYTPQPVMTDPYGSYKLVLTPGEYKLFAVTEFFQTQGSFTYNVTSGSVLSDLAFYLHPATPAFCQMIQYQNFLFNVPIYSNGTTSSVFYDIIVRALSFKITAANEAARKFLVVVPRGLLDGTPVVFVNNSTANPPIIEGANYFFVTLEESVGSHDVTIQGSNTIPEVPAPYSLVAMSFSLVAVFVASLKRMRRKCTQHS